LICEVFLYYAGIEKEIITWNDLEKTIKSKVLILSKIRKDRKRQMDSSQVIKKNLSFFNKLWKDYKMEMKEIFCNYSINDFENKIAI